MIVCIVAHKNKQNYSPYKARKEKVGHSLNTSPDSSAAEGTLRAKRDFKPEKVFSVEEANDRLEDLFRNHDFSCSHTERKKLAEFYFLLMKNQEHQNFTRLLKIKDIAIKHFIDSMMITELIDIQFPLLDVGTGPGFPGIPLKIRYPEQKILLAEGVQKRVEFLKTVRHDLQLKNLDIIGRNINPYFVYPVQSVITRAVEDIPNTLTNVLSCLQEGGFVYFMKGPGVDPEIDMAKSKMSSYYRLEKDIAYDLKHTQNHRRLVVYRKIKNAPLPEDLEEEVE